ncbi:MarR family winged helix-turn-helix transcriptional regulator [Shimia sp.]|uniref:MarR family winged helix-turn-helix transcriptional regulator n=1 Tax=Shimia sp. TaxID=1954381 RepID=UPI003B8C5945
MSTPRPETIAAWTALVSVNGSLLEDIETALKNAKLPKLSWYDALWEIEKVGAAGIRPYELRERLLLPQYALSRLLDRIAKAGLIERQDAKEDGRGQKIKITPEGRAKRHAMWPIYADVLNRSIEQRLTQTETAELAHLLKKLMRG